MFVYTYFSKTATEIKLCLGQLEFTRVSSFYEVQLTLIDLEPKPEPGFLCACLSGYLAWQGGPSAL